MIDPALVLLARLRLGAWFRRIKRGLATKRGIAFFIIGAALFLMWLLPVIIASVTGHQSGAARTSPDRVRDVMPLVLLGITLAMVVLTGGKSISFSPAEVDFLFPGPFSRRQLVLWKIAITGFATIWVSLFLSVWQIRNSTLWIAAIIGIWMAWMFAQSLAMLILLARQAIKAASASPLTRGCLLGLFVLSAYAIFDLLRPIGPWLRGQSFSFADFVAHKRQSLPARALMAPFDVLTMTFTSERAFPDLIMGASASAIMLVIVIWLILKLDAYFIETSLRASEAVSATVARLKRGGNPFGGGAKPLTSLRVPMLPWLGGSGPVAWRQFMLAARGARGIALVLLLLAFGLAPFAWIMSKSRETSFPLFLMAGFWIVFLLPSMVRFDFRGDLAHIESLKLLPVSPNMIAVGQMLAPALTLSLLVSALVVLVIACYPAQALAPAIAALLTLPPLMFFVIGVENITFLMFPTAQQMSTPGDMSGMGRSMVVLFVKAMALAVVLGMIAAIAWLAWAITQSWIITVAAGWMLMAISAGATVPIVGRLFARFDPSLDVPAQ